MTDKEKIKEEILRRKQSWQHSDKQYEHGGKDVCDYLLGFIDSLPKEPASEDLEEAANQHSKQVFHGLLVEDNITAFKAGAEWQKQKNQETIELAEDHAMLAGMNKMKEEMMKDAVDAFVNTYENTDDSNYVEFVTEQSPYKFKEIEKCKLIIVKED